MADDIYHAPTVPEKFKGFLKDNVTIPVFTVLLAASVYSWYKMDYHYKELESLKPLIKIEQSKDIESYQKLDEYLHSALHQLPSVINSKKVLREAQNQIKQELPEEVQPLEAIIKPFYTTVSSYSTTFHNYVEKIDYKFRLLQSKKDLPKNLNAYENKHTNLWGLHLLIFLISTPGWLALYLEDKNKREAENSRQTS